MREDRSHAGVVRESFRFISFRAWFLRKSNVRLFLYTIGDWWMDAANGTYNSPRDEEVVVDAGKIRRELKFK